MRPTKRAVSKPVSFRLGTAEHAKLVAEAERRQVSSGDLARALVTAAMNDEQHVLRHLGEVRAELSELRIELMKQRDAFAKGFEWVLLNVAKDPNAEAIRRWATENLRR